MTTAAQLLRQGRKQDIWEKYCGFLDLSTAEFMTIQERLLLEQISKVSASELGKRLLNGSVPKDLDEFRARVPLSTYQDYRDHFDCQQEDGLSQKTHLWAHTSGRSGKMKWIPYTYEAYQKLGERVLAGVLLAAAREKGEVHIAEGDALLYNTPPRPYISGVALRAVADQFDFRFLPPLEITEELEFQERIEMGFNMAMKSGVDILGSLAVVLVKMGERFEEGANTQGFSWEMLYPKTLYRLLRAYLTSKIQGRNILPKDLWRVKAIPSGGMDTSIYRERIKHYWGIYPHEQYGSTEEGSIATQTWTKDKYTFFPDAAFLEFVPVEEWDKMGDSNGQIPQTRLMDEVEVDKPYELVITNYYQKPLIRYRTNDIIKFTSLEDGYTGIKLPQMAFVGRSNDLIDLAGFTGIMDEKMIWQAILGTGIKFEEWLVRKEVNGTHPILHIYIELISPVEKPVVWEKIHQNLKKLNPYYGDYEQFIKINPLKVTLLNRGTYQAYMRTMYEAGADLAHLKPPHMNASIEIVEKILELSRSQA
ncbi:MAG: GH3 auxin-responsive promoter family protein [Anaerolineae bacterium]|nr:GH3 auxin-responsive promoter family protein [Anaerolineae bacterium]